FPAGAREVVKHVPDLARLMGELGYDLRSVEEDKSSAPAALNDVVTRLDAKTWRLNPPFQQDGPRGWLVPLRLAGELSGLAAVADDLANPRRSPLILYEDGRPLGPPHSLHDHIRQLGEGRYSHWALGH